MVRNLLYLQLVNEIKVLFASDFAANLLDLHRSGLGQLDAHFILQLVFKIINGQAYKHFTTLES